MKATKTKVPEYVRDKSMPGFYYLCFLNENGFKKVWIDKDHVEIQKNNTDFFKQDFIENTNDFEEITELEFLEKLHFAKSLF